MRSLDESCSLGLPTSFLETTRVLNVPIQSLDCVRLIAFSIGALPQVVKLCAMRGIVRTQICALLFLGSLFMVI